MNFWQKLGRFLFSLFIHLLIFTSVFLIVFSIAFYFFFNIAEDSSKGSKFNGGKNLINELPVIRNNEDDPDHETTP